MAHKNPIFPVRLEPELRKYVDEMAARSKISGADVIRMAIVLAYEQTVKTKRRTEKVKA